MSFMPKLSSFLEWPISHRKIYCLTLQEMTVCKFLLPSHLLKKEGLFLPRSEAFLIFITLSFEYTIFYIWFVLFTHKSTVLCTCPHWSCYLNIWSLLTYVNSGVKMVWNYNLPGQAAFPRLLICKKNFFLVIYMWPHS